MSSRPNAPTPAIPGVELLEVIGSGGSGVVYRGRQLAFGRDVAVKIATAGAGAGDEAVARWEREVAAVGRLSNHPNIVPVFDAGITEAGAPYLVMAYVPEGTLGDRLRQEGPLEPEEVAAIGAKLAGTLATVHAAGVLHRDVKPDNVLWSPHGEPQLTDFGIARLQDITATLTGNLHATIAYAAPEVLAGQPATEASDVYGLGATLYACLTGAPPHPAEGGQHVVAHVAKVLETDPDPLPAHVPSGLAAVVERAIARDPGARHPDAGALRDDLARLAAGAGWDDDSGPEHTQVLPATDVAPTRVEPAIAATAAHAPSPPPSPTPAPAPVERTRPPLPPPDGRGNRALWLGVVAVLVLAGGLLLLAAMNDEGSDGDRATDGTAPTTAPAEAAAPEDTEPATTEAPTTEPTTTESTEPETTTTAEPSDAGGADAAADTAVTYLETLDADQLDEAWAMTTPRFQAQQDRESWEAFWGGHDIEIVGDPVVDLGSGTVTVPLTYDGQREDYVLDVVEQGGGWLIDGPVGG
ncbi:MAG TPA: serine/threonine-protein kinase [Acidimicrobiales bacterium]|nr:serine/threonine-protein kinase [Acidimicrobiales bacterium]